MSESSYTNPRGLYEFQAKLSAYCILRPNNLAVVDPGLGKTHLGLATAAFLLDDGVVDHAIFVVEKNKLDEWEEDFERFTSLDVNVFHGPKRTMRDAQVTLTTYSTLRSFLTTSNPADSRAVYPGEGIEHFRGKRLVIVCDEVATLGGSRTSKVFQAFQMAVSEWRKSAEVRILGMSATPMSRSPENYYNLTRIIDPSLIGTVREFHERYVVSVNKWYQPTQFRNLEDLERRLSPIMLRKRKTDPDVIDQFPRLVEKFVQLRLDKAHLDAYKEFDSFIGELSEADQLPAFRALNAFVCHPRTVLSSGWKGAQAWVEQYGADRIERLSSRKAEAVIGYVREALQEEGSGILVFSNSVTSLQCLAADIRKLRSDESFEFVEFHGGQSEMSNREAKSNFRDGGARVMLASSKAERGINLPEAHFIVNYDVPTTHSSYMQRLSRGSRIGSNASGILTAKTFIARGTIEKPTVGLWQRRNEWSDQMQDAYAHLSDPNFVSAHHRSLMIRMASKALTEQEKAA